MAAGLPAYSIHLASTLIAAAFLRTYSTLAPAAIEQFECAGTTARLWHGHRISVPDHRSGAGTRSGYARGPGKDAQGLRRRRALNQPFIIRAARQVATESVARRHLALDPLQQEMTCDLFSLAHPVRAKALRPPSSARSSAFPRFPPATCCAPRQGRHSSGPESEEIHGCRGAGAG